MQNQINFEQTQENLRKIELQVLELLKYSNPQKYLQFLKQINDSKDF